MPALRDAPGYQRLDESMVASHPELDRHNRPDRMLKVKDPAKRMIYCESSDTHEFFQKQGGQ
jgi:hypothetical protein